MIAAIIILMLKKKRHRYCLLEGNGKTLTEHYADARENESRDPIFYYLNALENQKSPPMSILQNIVHNGQRFTPVVGY